MSNSEFAFFNKEKGFLTSKAANLARDVLPEGLKRRLKAGLRREPLNFPLPLPVEKHVLGYSANFGIYHPNDYQRIVKDDYESGFLEEFLGTVKTLGDAVVVDVGSAQGLYSVFAVKAGAGKVYAFDPDPISVESLEKNLKLNTDVYPKIDPRPIALGSSDGSINLNIDRRGVYAPSSARTSKGFTESIMVPVRKLDSLIEEGQISMPRVVKIDVEGAEGSVVDGMIATLAQHTIQDLFVEFHLDYLPKFGRNPIDIARAVIGQGYEVVGNPKPRRSEVHVHFSLS